MQLAHPAVAAGVAQHSDFTADPFGRLVRTLRTSYTVVFGTSPEADAAIRRVNAIHEQVHGHIPETGERYRARDPQLLLWVHATLIDTALRMYDRFVRPLSPNEAQGYHAEARQIAVGMGVPEDAVPLTLRELRSAMDRLMTDGVVRVSPTARRLSRSVLYPTGFPPRFVWDAVHLASIWVMPAPIRRGYGIRWSPARERGLRRVAQVSRRLVPLLPGVLREMPQARDAERRLGLRG
jgi:uncharacterized protein (DUF2236 family)